MGKISYFFDTYALFEIIGGNKDYLPYQKAAIITTQLNLFELHYGLLLKYGKDVADRYYDRLMEYTVDFGHNEVKQASLFRAINKKKKMSYVDCLGYIIALSKNVQFLTGDKAFEGVPNVVFVK